MVFAKFHLLKSFRSGALCIGAGHHHDLSNATRLGSSRCSIQRFYTSATTASLKGVHKSQIRETLSHSEFPGAAPFRPWDEATFGLDVWHELH